VIHVAKAAPGVASAGSGALFGLLLLTEAGLPIPIPADLLMLLLGERVSAGALPLAGVLIALQAIAILGTLGLFWVVRGPGRQVLMRFGPKVGVTEARIERVSAMVAKRGTPAVALGRSTPGLRTVTVVAAAGTGRSDTRLLLALIAGSTLFVQGHFLLGLALGPAARALFEAGGKVAVVVLLALLVIGGIAVWFRRRRGSGGLQSFSEACCPACLAVGLVYQRSEIRRSSGA